MRTRLAGVLRRMADRLAPQTHHVAVTHSEGAVDIYIDGKRLHDSLLRYKRRNGLGDLGLG